MSTLSRLESGGRRPTLELLLTWRAPTGWRSTGWWGRRRPAGAVPRRGMTTVPLWRRAERLHVRARPRRPRA